MPIRPDEEARAEVAVVKRDGALPIVVFAARVAIVIFAITLAISWFVDTYLPDSARIKEKTNKFLENRENRLRLNGLLSSNPRVNYELSLLREQKQDMAGAMDEIIIAIGILEKAGARPEVMDPYTRRLNSLRSAQGAAKSEAAPAGAK